MVKAMAGAKSFVSSAQQKEPKPIQTLSKMSHHAPKGLGNSC